MDNLNRVPSWLTLFHRTRQTGLKPRHNWIVIQAGGRIANWVPAISVPPTYKARPNDDFSAFCGLDCELLIDDETSYGLVRGLVTRILHASPRALWVLTCGQHQTYILLKKVDRHGTL